MTDLFSKSEVPSMCLRDVERTEAFRAAINQVVKPGDIILDAGAGSGILSFFAAAAGAQKVYSVEYDPGLADLLRRNAALNGFAEVIEVIAGDVRELRLPVQADVLIAELIETWLLDELQIPALNALRANRVIGAKTRIIPERYEAFATFGHVDFSCYGFQVPFPLHDWPDLGDESGWLMLPFHPMTEAVKVFDLKFNKYNTPNFKKTIRADSLTEGMVNAVRLSGMAYLTPDLTLGPTVAFNGNKVLPLDAFAVQAGDPVSWSLSGNWGGRASQTDGNRTTSPVIAQLKSQLAAEPDSISLLNEDIESHRKLTLIFDQELGRGIAAREVIETGEIITSLRSSGSLTLSEIRAATDAIDEGLLDPKALKILYDVIQVDEDQFLLPTPSVGFLLNHSCDPNAALVAAQNGFVFRVIRKIAVGEEVRWNYITSMGDWYTMQCKCGSSTCCGIVAGPLSLSCLAREEMLKQFGEELLLSHIVRWLKTEDCPNHLTGERYLRDFEGEAAMKEEILLKHPRLHPEVHNRVRAALSELA